VLRRNTDGARRSRAMCPTLSTQNSGALQAVAAFLIIVAIPILILFGQDIRPLTGQECPSGLPYAQALQQCWLAGRVGHSHWIIDVMAGFAALYGRTNFVLALDRGCSRHC
jgi:hypothetical protein